MWSTDSSWFGFSQPRPPNDEIDRGTQRLEWKLGFSMLLTEIDRYFRAIRLTWAFRFILSMLGVELRIGIEGSRRPEKSGFDTVIRVPVTDSPLATRPSRDYSSRACELEQIEVAI